MKPTQTDCYAAMRAGADLVPYMVQRRAPGPHDVVVEVLFCGVCHSDYHYVSGEWGSKPFPAVPGHEILGRVRSIGASVSRHRQGDYVGVGCLADSCRTCPSCVAGEEQYCVEQWAYATYGGTEKQTGRPTYGGYSRSVVVDERFVLSIPSQLRTAAAAPLLCAGITTYSPLRHRQIGPRSRVGIVGFGGLGHMAVKLATAMGAEAVVFTTSPLKAEDARRMGAADTVISTDVAALARHTKRLDLILDTVAASHDLDRYLRLLRRDGTLVLLGLPPTPNPPVTADLLVNGRVNLSGSLIGGIRETQEMLELCAAHHIVCDVETIRMDQINEAFRRMLRGDVKYRFVIDMETMANARPAE
jgi:uncharacterized zinc-type alcohol dehydrogenase-like protein